MDLKSLCSLGFEEDHAASSAPECVGLFKSQYDTGKKLKTIEVFPCTIAAENEEDTVLQSFMGKMSKYGIHHFLQTSEWKSRKYVCSFFYATVAGNDLCKMSVLVPEDGLVRGY